MGHPALKQTDQNNLKENERKWTKAILASGWTAVPSVVLLYQQQLNLDPTDFNILMHIVQHWWYADRLPYPSKRHIAEAMNITPRTVQRPIERMEKRGLLKRVARKHHLRGSDTNIYDLTGLIEALKPYAEQALAEKEQKRVAASLRRRGAKRLRLVNPEDG